MQADLDAYKQASWQFHGTSFGEMLVSALDIASRSQGNTLIATGGGSRLGRRHALTFFLHTWLDHHPNGGKVLLIHASPSCIDGQFRDRVGAVGNGRLDIHAYYAQRISARRLETDYAFAVVEVVGESRVPVLPVLFNSSIPVITVHRSFGLGDHWWLIPLIDDVLHVY